VTVELLTLTCSPCGLMMKAPTRSFQHDWAISHVRSQKHTVVETAGIMTPDGITIRSRRVRPDSAIGWITEDWEQVGAL